MPRTGRPRNFTEAAVIEAASELFWQEGYVGTSVQRLGHRTGVLPGSLYAAFGDKHALFMRALEHYMEGQRKAGAWLQEPGPVLPRLREMMYAIAAGAQTKHPRGCMLGNTAIELVADPKATKLVRRAFVEFVTAVAHALSSAQSGGEVRADIDPGSAAAMLVATMQGMHVLARVQTDVHRLRATVDTSLELLAAVPA